MTAIISNGSLLVHNLLYLYLCTLRCLSVVLSLFPSLVLITYTHAYCFSIRAFHFSVLGVYNGATYLT